MSVKWYEEHLEAIVKENQTLRFQQQKKVDQLQQSINYIHSVFQQLFPDVPHLSVSHLQGLDHLLNYYRRIGGKWMEMVQQKLRLLEQPIKSKDYKAWQEKEDENMKAHLSVKQRERCILCGNLKDRSAYDCLIIKIQKLQSEIGQLRNQIDQLEEQSDKYLKEISYLRSITKKMQYQLAQQMLTNRKVDKVQTLQQKDCQEQIVNLKNQVEIWKSEYERVWQEQVVKIRGSVGRDSTFQEERALLNTLYKQQRDIFQHPNSHGSHFWMIQSHSIQPLKTEDKKEDVVNLPTTSRLQQNHNIK